MTEEPGTSHSDDGGSIQGDPDSRANSDRSTIHISRNLHDNEIVIAKDCEDDLVLTERSAMSSALEKDVDGEWSYLASSRDMKLDQSLKSSIATKETRDSNNLHSVRTKYTFTDNTFDENQLEDLKHFLFDSLTYDQSSPPGRGFGRSNEMRRLASTKSLEVGSIFQTGFDLTEDRLRRQFNSLDGSRNGLISYEDLKVGLAKHGVELGLSNIDDRTFKALVRYLDADQSGGITFPEFSEGIRLLMVRSLLQKYHSSRRMNDKVLTEIFDYNSLNLNRYVLKGIGQVQTKVSFVVSAQPMIDFFLHHRGDEVSVRWINITGKRASKMMKLMALKYRLHPIALEDALESTMHRPKADSYDGHYFIMVPVFYLKELKNRNASFNVTKPDKLAWYNALSPPQLKSTLNNAFFPAVQSNEISGDDEKPVKQATDTRGSDDNDDDDGPRNNFIGEYMTSIFISKPYGKTVITFNNQSDEERCWYDMQEELKKDYSKLREYDGQYLAYRLLDETVDKIGDIVKELNPVVKMELKSLEKTNFENLDRIHSLQKELHSMSRRLKPFLRLLCHLIEDDNFSAGATIYLRDVLDNLEIHDEDVKLLIAKCDSADAVAEKVQQQKIDNTLYILTVFTVTFLPAQFLTGKWVDATQWSVVGT
jgi:Mg2+ and Co2+ transporter CorA